MEQSVQVLSECPMGRSKMHTKSKKNGKYFIKFVFASLFPLLIYGPLFTAAQAPARV